MEYIPTKTILSRCKMPQYWFGADYNMNLYRGCPHGCIYCDSRSQKYGIADFDEASPKENALAILRQELKGMRKSGVIATGAMSDPYNPLEEEKKYTRSALELIREYGFGVAICTKSALVSRDIDILLKIREHAPVLVKMTVTTADDSLARKIEPNVSLPSLRFEALTRLSAAGIFCGVLMMPMLPFLEDNEKNVQDIIAAAKGAGVNFLYPSFSVTMRENQRDYFYENLDEHFPGLKAKYQKQFGSNYVCLTPKADRLSRLVKGECAKAGLVFEMEDIIAASRKGYADQMSLC